MQELEKSIKNIGYNIAFENSIRFGVSFLFRLITGFLGGLPATALSANSSISYVLSIFFEFPAGLIADIFGSFKAVHLGYFFQSIAALSLFLSIYLYPNNETLMWVFIIIEAILDALGNSLLSGARESSHQSIVEIQLRNTNIVEANKIYEKYLAFAERYGRPLLILVPSILIGFGLFSYKNGYASYSILLVALFWLGANIQFYYLWRGFPFLSTKNSHKFIKNIKIKFSLLKEFNQKNFIFYNHVFIWIVNVFVYLTTMSYLIIRLLINFNSTNKNENIKLILIFISSLILGRLCRTYILPYLINRYSNFKLIFIFSFVLLIGLTILILSTNNKNFSIVPFSIFIAFYDICYGLITRPLLGLIIPKIHSDIRSSYLSVLSSIILILQAFLACYLFIMGESVPSMLMIYCLLIISCTLTMVFIKKNEDPA